jgi:hypothetical protein
MPDLLDELDGVVELRRRHADGDRTAGDFLHVTAELVGHLPHSGDGAGDVGDDDAEAGGVDDVAGPARARGR